MVFLYFQINYLFLSKFQLFGDNQNNKHIVFFHFLNVIQLFKLIYDLDR